MNGHCNHLALKFSVCVKERQDRLPTMYWLPKLHKTPYKARFIANSSSCTTTELSKLLTSCLTAVKNHVIRYCEKVYERSGKNLFCLLKILLMYLNIHLDILNIDNPYFEGMVNRIYPPELQLNKAYTSDTEAPFLDLHLSISNGFVSSKIYD